MNDRRLRRSPDQRMLGGVIGGLAEYFDRDATLLRVLYVVISVLSAAFPGIFVYLLLWIIIPLRKAGERADPARSALATPAPPVIR